MDIMKKISVVVATFNGEQYIQKQIESITNQSIPPDEIIICDDKSTDGTVSIVKSLLKNYKGILRIIENSQNIGYKKNFINAYNFCTGDIVFFADQDDIWIHNKIERIITSFTENCVVVSHNYSVINSRGEILIKDYFKELLAHGKRRQDSAKGCALAIHKAILPNSIPQSHSNQAHDVLFLKLGILSSSVKFIDDILILHRIHASNHSGRLVKKVSSLVALIRKINFMIKFRNSEILYCISSIPNPHIPFYIEQLKILQLTNRVNCTSSIRILQSLL
jgi:glycosyltransferase involved in cell wall biosynthesis